jgi:hypothetical protein
MSTTPGSTSRPSGLPMVKSSEKRFVIGLGREPSDRFHASKIWSRDHDYGGSSWIATSGGGSAKCGADELVCELDAGLSTACRSAEHMGHNDHKPRLDPLRRFRDDPLGRHRRLPPVTERNHGEPQQTRRVTRQ